VAERMSLSQWQVRQMIRRGELRHVRVGRFLRVPESAIDDWIAENERTGYTYNLTALALCR